MSKGPDIAAEVDRLKDPAPEDDPGVDALAKKEDFKYKSEQQDYLQKCEITKLMKLEYWLKIIFAPAVTFIVLAWLVFIAGVVWKCAKVGDGKFELSPNVLIALIGGSSANVIGLLTIVMLYIFHKRKIDK